MSLVIPHGCSSFVISFRRKVGAEFLMMNWDLVQNHLHQPVVLKRGLWLRTELLLELAFFVSSWSRWFLASWQKPTRLLSLHHGPKPCKLRTTSEEVWAFITFLLRVMAERKSEERALIRSEEFRTWSLLSQKKCEFLSSHLMCSYDSLIPAFNEGLRSIIQAGGVSCIDEVLFPWYGQSPFVVDVKGKPNDHGLRCFVHVVRLSCTCLPVPIRIMPELCRPIYSASQILDTFTLQTYEAPMSVTADAYFASIDWLAAHPSIISYHALKLPKFPFLPLLYYNLPVRCCRIFRRAGICVSVWHDDTARKHETTLRACATNAYPGSAFHSAPPSLLPCLGSSFAVGPRYPPTFLPALEDATTEHLKQLAQSVGVTTGGTKSELAHRICGFPPPRSSLTLPPSHSSSSASAFNSSLTRKQLQTELIKRGKHSSKKSFRLVSTCFRHSSLTVCSWLWLGQPAASKSCSIDLRSWTHLSAMLTPRKASCVISWVVMITFLPTHFLSSMVSTVQRSIFLIDLIT